MSGNRIVIHVENLSKQYRLGQVGTGTLSHDLKRWWHRVRGKEDPFLKIGETNDRTINGESEYVWALQSINFEVGQGEVLGIIGRNGAGKSTLLKILSRTTAPTTGTIKLRGRVASLLEVGTGFHPELSGRENIFLNGAILGMTKRETVKKFDAIVDFAGVERYIDTPVKRYSSGMYVRLAFAVAAHLEPEILIVDEVLAVGDAEFQKKALGKMQEVSVGEGKTVLFVSHNMTAVKSLCNKAMILQNGFIRSIGKTDEQIHLYLNQFLEQLLKIEWEEELAAGGDNVKMRRIEIKPLYLDGQSAIRTNTAVRIEFEFSIKQEEYVLINFQLRTIKDEIIFHIDSTDLKLKEGNYIATCLIPSNFLNDGKYKISRIQIITNHNRVEHRFNEELIFNVEDFRTKIFWHGDWPGMIRPLDFISFEIVEKAKLFSANQ